MSGPEGLLVVDKPVGPTSHDVVGRLRRLFATRRVGHAGTLDPMATGVLVALVGEATKLSAWLVLDDKRYEARIVLGRATDTLDATGKTTAEAATPAWLADEVATLAAAEEAPCPGLRSALAGEVARTEQVPPDFSAIQQDGQRAYARARAGAPLALPPRAVAVRSLTLSGGGVLPAGDADAGRPYVDVAVDVGKGYYVRSLARDLGEAVGMPALLSALRRTSSGPFDLARAVTLEALAAMPPTDRWAALLRPTDAVREAMPCITLTDEGARRARLGHRLSADHVTADRPPPKMGPVAWIDGAGALVGIGELRGEELVVLRNMSTANP